MHQRPAHEAAAYPRLTQYRLEGAVPHVQAAPHHFEPTYTEHKKGITVKFKTCSFNARSFKEPERRGREQKRKNTRVAALREQFEEMGMHVVGIQESRLPRGTFLRASST